ncbi:thioesterase domain-containing protein [Arthrobacter sp. StoSoilB13]|uniref:thioesterase II family protein n=1 Tax=Arthrobacter sp. StoSoilB13 TaxID=2830993 RepID=UPI001CC545EF|nr:thioesterase domain-containing protein [Arthrobacter sp. StoSoilB13]BCW49940.1 thioesterase [Arthrobacter sp. StoSoilB13]
MHLFCLHHAGGTTASFAGWRFDGVHVTKLGYRGRDFRSVGAAAAAMADRIASSQSGQLALYGHSMGAVLAFEAALRLQDTGRVLHVFLAAARPPSGMYDAGAAAAAAAGAHSERAREVLLEDLELLDSYPERLPARQLKVPATVLYSPDDPVVTASESRRWADWCAQKPRLIEVVGGGHLFHIGNPKVRAIVAATLSDASVHTETL